MSTEISFSNVSHIIIGPVQSSLCYQAAGSQFSSRRLEIHCKDGSLHGLTLLSLDDHITVALGELITSTKVSA